MPRTTHLTNRFPQIIAALDPKVSAALELGAELVAAEAKTRVPVASGDLKEAIHVEPDDGGFLVVAGDDEDVFYAHFVELGSTQTDPHPFLIPALEARRDEVTALVGAAMRRL
jgi:HK97 gp10 family phage protein